MKALVISNPFKGTLSSARIGEIVTKSLKEKNIDSIYIPSTDGGDGFFDAFKHIKLNAITKEVMVRMPVGSKHHKVKYLFDPTSKTTYISISDTCGIKYLDKKDPFMANTYGFGEALKYSIINDKPQTVVMGLGGSASVDLGAGFFEALGMKYYDRNHNELKDLCNKNLNDIKDFDDSSVKDLSQGIKFKVLLDVKSDIFSKSGAVESYSLTKGAKPEDIKAIKNNVLNLFNIFKTKYKDVKDAPGFGAAGGIAFSIFYILNAELLNGALEFLKEIDYNNLINDYDVIITGEGRVDSQTLEGKLIKAIIDNSKNKRVIIISGINESNIKGDIYSIVPMVMSLDESLKNPELGLTKLIEKIDF